jgi:dephospho-CoA kinase
MEGDNRPLSEQYRVIAKKWVDLDNAARLLEETKTTVLEERKNALVQQNEKLADNAAERQVKADPEWREWIEAMVKARTAANLAKVQLRYIEMRWSEQQSFEATRRAEMKL